MLEKSGMKPADFQWAVFHQPNGKFPMRAGKMLGFTREQIETGWLVPTLGNTYSGASPMGLTAILDIAQPGELVLLTSFGSGAGSGALGSTGAGGGPSSARRRCARRSPPARNRSSASSAVRG